MTQPSYDPKEIAAWSNAALANELNAWATSREVVSRGRIAQGKRPLDSVLLREAATRLGDS